MRLYVVLIILGLVLGWWLPLGAATINLAWDASSGADGYELHYGLASGTYTQTVDTGMATTASIAGLMTGATYYFAALAYNAVGRSDYSNEVHGVATDPLPGDTIPPTVTLTSPLDGSTVPRKSIVTLAAEAVDNVAVVRVAFWLNGVVLCSTTTVPYTCAWEVPAPPRRQYTLQATAVAAAGNIGTSATVEVTAN
jgi:Bacterial Ig domain/Fibronectin type III domain